MTAPRTETPPAKAQSSSSKSMGAHGPGGGNTEAETENRKQEHFFQKRLRSVLEQSETQKTKRVQAESAAPHVLAEFSIPHQNVSETLAHRLETTFTNVGLASKILEACRAFSRGHGMSGVPGPSPTVLDETVTLLTNLKPARRGTEFLPTKEAIIDLGTLIPFDVCLTDAQLAALREGLNDESSATAELKEFIGAVLDLAGGAKAGSSSKAGKPSQQDDERVKPDMEMLFDGTVQYSRFQLQRTAGEQATDSSEADTVDQFVSLRRRIEEAAKAELEAALQFESRVRMPRNVIVSKNGYMIDRRGVPLRNLHLSGMTGATQLGAAATQGSSATANSCSIEISTSGQAATIGPLYETALNALPLPLSAQWLASKENIVSALTACYNCGARDHGAKSCPFPRKDILVRNNHALVRQLLPQDFTARDQSRPEVDRSNQWLTMKDLFDTQEKAAEDADQSESTAGPTPAASPLIFDDKDWEDEVSVQVVLKDNPSAPKMQKSSSTSSL